MLQWWLTPKLKSKFVNSYLTARRIRIVFLDAFWKLRKATINLAMSLSVRPHRTTRLPLEGFSWNFIWVYFENLSRKYKFRLNPNTITVTLHEDLCTYLITSLSVLLRMRNVLDQCFSTAGPRPGTGPWHQLFWAARGSPGICHFSFLSIFYE